MERSLPIPKEQILFTFELAQPRKVIAITGQGRPTYFVSQNKRFCLWHHRLAHISNVCVARASKLVDGIDLGLQDIEYDTADVLINSDNSDAFDLSDISISEVTAIANQTTIADDSNIFNKLCMLYIGSK